MALAAASSVQDQMDACKVCYQGEPGAYSEAAAYELLGSGVTAVGLPSFEECFGAVESGEAAYAMLPIENSLGGSIHANYDLQLRHRLHIVAELDFRVRHCLMALPGVGQSDVTRVISHPQALAQCDGYLRKCGLRGTPTYDTAGSAKMIAAEGQRNTAAIASRLAAKHYGLEVLDAGIEDNDMNFTRFLLLSKRCLAPGPSPTVPMKTSLVFSLSNAPGVLFKALAAFSLRDIDLTKIESRPDKTRLAGRQLEPLDDKAVAPAMAHQEGGGGRFRYMFYVDCCISLGEQSMVCALQHLSEMAPFIRVLGSYPRSGALTGFVQDEIQALSLDVITAADPSPVAIPPATVAAPASAASSLPPIPASGSTPLRLLRVGIVGFGNFGQFLAKTLVRQGHTVFATSRTDYGVVASSLGVTFDATPTAMLQRKPELDVVILAVSILSFERVVRALPLQALGNVLVLDVLSVKTLPKRCMMSLLPSSCDILCTHPMFGPESGKHSWAGLPCVFERVRCSDGKRADAALNIFNNEGCRMVEMDCEHHDAAAAGSQFVTHFTGRMLARLGLRSTPINTKGFETLLALVENTCSDSFDLFLALFKCNPNSTAQLDAMRRSMATLVQELLADSTADNDCAEGAARTSKLVNRVTPSVSSALYATVLRLKREGRDLIGSLTVGEPSFYPPPAVLKAVREAGGAEGGDPQTRYTAVTGTHVLRCAIADDQRRRKGVAYNAEGGEVLVTHGGKQAIYCAVVGTCDPGDEVIVPTPFWVSYPEIVKLAGATPVFVDRTPESGFKLSAAQLEAALTPRTRMLILCNPCNPTGALYTRDELECIAQVLRKPPHVSILILADEIYERLSYDGVEHVSFASLPGMQRRTLLVNGFSKGFAMTGLRLGYLAGDARLIKAAHTLQSQINSCPCSVSQHAGVAALGVPEAELRPLYDALVPRRDLVVARLNAIDDVICYKGSGAFYAFPDVSAYLGVRVRRPTNEKAVLTSVELCEFLLEEYGVSAVPGDAFGRPGYLRLSYAASMDDIVGALDRIEAGLQALLRD